jgi:protease-4
MKSVKRLLGYLWLALDGLRKVLHLFLLLLFFGVLFAVLSPSLPIIPAQAVLVINPQGALVEQVSGGPLDRAIADAYGYAQSETRVRDIVEAIDIAKTDNRIQGIVLDLGNLSGGGLSKLEEISTAIKSFRAAGKRVIAMGENYDKNQYYLAAHADEIYLDPHGLLFIDGYGYYRTFLKGAIDKLGVDVNVFRAGKFKSYTDQFSRNDMSEQEREESSAWLNSLWNSYQSAVTAARGMQPDAVAAYVGQTIPALRANGGDFAAIAVERGLVNELKTRRQVEQRLMALAGENKDTHSFNGIDFQDYLEVERPRRALSKVGGKKVGVVIASGEILDGEQPSGTIGGDSLAHLLREAIYDDDIAAVVLRIDSPGGSVFASEVIRREVVALKAAGKSVVASMGSTAASGGYYIAMNADEIWASATTLTGSIGVFAVLPTFERTLAKVGVHSDGIGTTALSGTFNLERSLTAEQKEVLQLSVDHEYREFVANVAAARGKTSDEIDAVAQGRVWAGDDAKAQGLVDQLGLMKDAINAAAQRANLEEGFEVKYIEPHETWRQMFANEVHILSARVARWIAPEQQRLRMVLARLSPVEAELKRLARFTDPYRAYYYCMCTVQ